MSEIKEASKKLIKQMFETKEATLLKDHGQDKKGDKIQRHPGTIKMLRERGIVK